MSGGHARVLFWGAQAIGGVALLAAAGAVVLVPKHAVPPPVVVANPALRETPLTIRIAPRVWYSLPAPIHHHHSRGYYGHPGLVFGIPIGIPPGPHGISLHGIRVVSPSPSPKPVAHVGEPATVPIVYQRPTSLPWGRPSYFAVEIASADLTAARSELAAYHGAEQLHQMPYFSSVRMQLWGPPEQVEIDAEDAAQKDISTASNARWRWAVQPKVTDPITLTLSVYDTVAGKEHDGPEYTDTFTVNKPMVARIQDDVVAWNPVWLAITGGATLVASWVFAGWRRLVGESRTAEQLPSSRKAPKGP